MIKNYLEFKRVAEYAIHWNKDDVMQLWHEYDKKYGSESYEVAEIAALYALIAYAEQCKESADYILTPDEFEFCVLNAYDGLYNSGISYIDKFTNPGEHFDITADIPVTWDWLRIEFKNGTKTIVKGGQLTYNNPPETRKRRMAEIW